MFNIGKLPSTIVYCMIICVLNIYKQVFRFLNSIDLEKSIIFHKSGGFI